MAKNTLKHVVYRGLFLFLFCFSLAEGSDMCSFNGLVPDSSLWETDEFSILLEDEAAPGYLVITRAIGQIAVATNIDDLISPSCEISEYIKALMKYYEKNKATIREKHGEIADLLDFIKIKLTNR